LSVDIVIVNFNTCDLLRECIESVERARSEVADLHVFVVDNASADASVEMVRGNFPWVELIPLSENLGFGAGNNRGVEIGSGDYLLFLNSDAQLTPMALSLLVDFLEAHPECVAVGPRLIYPDGTFQPSCRRFPTLLRYAWSLSGMGTRLQSSFPHAQTWLSEEEHAVASRVDMVSGACFLMRRAYFQEVGGFDENLFLFEEEFDLFYALARRGLHVCYCPTANVIHGKGKSVQVNRMANFARFHLYRSKYYVFRKHYGKVNARLSYWTDLGILGLSGFFQRIRRKPAHALTSFRLCRLAWPAAKLSAEQLRALDLKLPE